MRSEKLQSSDQVRLANRNLSVMEVQSPASSSLEVSNSGVQDLGAFNLPSAAGHVDASESSVLNAWNERNAEFGVDLEELMMMEAIWRSIQDTASHKCAPEQSSGSNGIGRSQIENHLPYEIISSSTLIDPPDCLPSDSASGGIAIAVARIAERNILQSGTFHSIREISRTSQTQDESSMGEHEAGPFDRLKILTSMMQDQEKNVSPFLRPVVMIVWIRFLLLSKIEINIQMEMVSTQMKIQ